ncbi:MAG: hypothetical protein J6S14_12040 [Clostridia bacterium]|nr:hypothetical protein [Clostridia bacterium]
MAYTKQNWTTGDTVTAEKLNHMESGIAEGSSGGGLVVGITNNPDTNLYECNKTAGEIWEAYSTGCNVVFSDTEFDDVVSLVRAYIDDGYWFYTGCVSDYNALYIFFAETADEYPVQPDNK